MKYTLLVLLLASAKTILCQTASPEDWIKSHPEVALIEHSDFFQFSQDDLLQFDHGYIVFSNKVTSDDIAAFLDNEKTLHKDPVVNENKEYISEWLIQNPNIKIVKRSEFEASTINQQEEYIKSNCLILRDEVISIVDINNF